MGEAGEECGGQPWEAMEEKVSVHPKSNAKSWKAFR